MNNWIITLALFMLGVFGLAGVVYGVWQRQNARSSALLATAKEYQALRDMHDGNVVQLAIAEQDVERLTSERDDAREQRDRILKELHKADEAIEKFIDEIASLKAQVAILVKERGHVDEVPARRPIRRNMSKKVGSE
jgi:chromosome segregation ATPase